MEQNIRQQLYDKMKKEYDNFINEIKKLSSKEIIDRAYEISIKEEFVSVFYPDDTHDINDIKILNKCEHPLETLYDDWMDTDLGINSVLRYSVEYTIENLIQDQKNKKQEVER